MSDLNRVYRLTSIAAPEVIDIQGLDRSFFEEMQTITEITDLDIRFRVERSLKRQPNRAEVVLHNLANRDEFVSRPCRIRLEAGYEGAPRLLFVGDLRFASHRLEGTDWITQLQLGDGARAYSKAHVNRSYAKGTPIVTIIGDIAKAFGVPLPPEVASSPDLAARIATGEALNGAAADELTRLLEEYGYEWSFQNGRLQIIPADAVVPGSLRLLSQDTGMIGSPQVDPPKIVAPQSSKRAQPRSPKTTIKHVLYPEIAPGEKIEVQSRSMNGVFRVDVVTHDGDTRGDDWTTTVEATAL
jgi:hypothetical protein